MSALQFAGVARAVIAALGGYLVGQGIVDASTVSTVGGALVTLATAAWSVWAKRA